jgi:phosphoribosylformylglycinamidine synthase
LSRKLSPAGARLSGTSSGESNLPRSRFGSLLASGSHRSDRDHGWKGVRPGGSDTEDGIVKANIKITLKPGVLDPQGKAIEHALKSLGFDGVNEVRQGKYIELELAETDEEKAREQVDRICKDLLANTVIEKYAYEIIR